MSNITWSQVHAFRLQRHFSGQAALSGNLLDVVSGTCGIQAQVMSAAQLALRARIHGLAAPEIEHALWQDRTLVKVWCMRGTLHVLPARELPLYVAALKPYRLKQEQRWMARYGVDAAAIETMADAIFTALSAAPLTRREISQAISPRLRKAAPQIQELLEHGWGGLGKYVCLQGNLCLGPNQGQEATFVRRDLWLKDWEDIPGEVAEDLLLKHYLRAYGPATVQDFAAWVGLAVKDASQIWGRLQAEMCNVDVEGSQAVILERDLHVLREAALATEDVRLLPHFDVYLLGHRSKSHLVDDAFYKRVYRAAGWISPVVLIDGRIAGVWSHRQRGKTLHVSVEPFDQVSRSQRAAIESRAADVADFCASSLKLAYTGTTTQYPAN
ncbi:MAG: winged helix DNA-binding domain-containing protein [Chloroflexi bacterium]|nr:winged helix DNA-binding domain-containing protein [Chloroflexota bacterium]